MADLAVEFVRTNCKTYCPSTGAFLVNHMIRIIDCYMKPYKPSEYDDDEIEIPSDIADRLTNAMVYAGIWGIGGAVEESTRHKFDTFFQELVRGDDVITKYEIDVPGEYEPTKIPCKIGDKESIFDLFFD